MNSTIPNAANHGIPWAVEDILAATRGRLLCGDKSGSFDGISTDSRAFDRGDLFVSIVGETHDGHRFIPEFIRQGGKGVLVDARRFLPENRIVCGIDDDLYDSWAHEGITIIAVADTIRALGDLARFQRLRAGVPVIAITGSNGKTTTKEMTAAVLRQRFDILATTGNFNNHIGMPLTLLKVTPGYAWVVLELGMNHPGEMEILGNICQPDIGIITNVAPAHIGGLGSIEGVARAKAELLQTIRPGGTAVLNGDDPHVRRLSRQEFATDRLDRIILFGCDDDANVRGLNVHEGENGTEFTLKLPEQCEETVRLKIPGAFMVYNALAAAAVGYLCGLSTSDIKNGLEQFTGVPGRMHIIRTLHGVHIIDDTYNANPSSMQAAIITLKSLKKHNNGFLVVGDMYELGEQTAMQHENLGHLAARSQVTGLFATGRFAEMVAKGAREAGLELERIFTGTKKDIAEILIRRLKPDDWVLFKGSRAMAMETTVQSLVDHFNHHH